MVVFFCIVVCGGWELYCSYLDYYFVVKICESYVWKLLSCVGVYGGVIRGCDDMGGI